MKNYVIYPQGMEKLEETGLSDRLDDSDLTATQMLDAMWREFGELKDEGFYNQVLREGKEEYMGKMENIRRGSSPVYWTVEKHDEEVKKEVSEEDALLFTGIPVFEMLDEEEVQQYSEEFGSFTQFASTAGAYILNNSGYGGGELDRKYEWETDTGERKFGNIITQNVHGDMEIFQWDETPYPVKGPFGNNINIRPLEREGIYPGHSVERRMLSIVLKYIDQLDREPDILSGGAEDFLEEIKEKSRERKTFKSATSHMDPETEFVSHAYDIPPVGEELSPHYIPTGSPGNGAYEAYLDDEKLVLFYSNEDKKEKKLVFRPQDADELLEGVFRYSSRGGGRTQVETLTEALEYYLSDDFEEDLEEI